MLIFKALHIISMVAWFAALFYLPRLFVYHVESTDTLGIARFKLMEQRLYYAIMWPAAILTTVFGLFLVSYNASYYLKSAWFHAKVALVIVLWGYHLLCGHYLKCFSSDANQHSSKYFRFFNELPTLLLIGIVFLVILRPGF